MIMRDRLPSQAELHRLVDYDPETGVIIWRERGIPHWDRRWAGRPAFVCENKGYLVGVINGVRSVGAHRIAFKYMNGYLPPEVDHINGNRADNRIANLRAASSLENNRNAARPSTNRSGVVGVRYRKDKRMWVANISINNRCKHLGYFTTKEEALARRKETERELGFHPNHGRVSCG